MNQLSTIKIFKGGQVFNGTQIFTGGDPRQYNEFIELRNEIEKLTHPARPEVNWQKVSQLSLTMFEKNGVDLQTAAYYTLARTEQFGLNGLEEGIVIILSLVEQQWGILWPRQIHIRIELLVWLVERLHQLLRTLHIDYSEITTVYRVEAMLAELCTILQRLELKHLSKLDTLRIFIGKIAQTLEQIDTVDLQQKEELFVTNSANINQVIRNPVRSMAKPSPNEQVVYVAKELNGRNLNSMDLNDSRSSGNINLFLSKSNHATLQPSLLKRCFILIFTLMIGMLLGGYLLQIATPYWENYQQHPLKLSILNRSQFPTASLDSALVKKIRSLPNEKQTEILAAIENQQMLQSEDYINQINQAPVLWLLEQGKALLMLNQQLWHDSKMAQDQLDTWRKTREANAASLEILSGYHQAKIQLEDLVERLNQLDNSKGKYLTGSELKTAVFSIQQPLIQSPPLEELLRYLAEVKTDPDLELDPTLIRQIETKFTQLLNRYYLLLEP